MGRRHCAAALYTEASQIERIHGESQAGKGMCDLSVLRESSGASAATGGSCCGVTAKPPSELLAGNERQECSLLTVAHHETPRELYVKHMELKPHLGLSLDWRS